MRPVDIGLPPQFTSFRAEQEDIALSIASSDKRFILLSAATGLGKSLIYMAASRLLDARTLVLTGTKGLQQQLSADFAPIGLTDIRGQNNYRCVAVDEGEALSDYGKPGTTCNDGPCHSGIFCSFKPTPAEPDAEGCTYYDAVAQAREAQLVVTNYSYWMTINRYGDPMALGKFDLLVLDEAHSVPDELADFCAIRLDRDEVRTLIEMKLPPTDEGADAWTGWASSALLVTRERYIEARRELLSIGGDKRKAGKLLRRLTDLGRGLKELATAHAWRRSEPGHPDVWLPGAATDWIAEKTATGVLFSPVWAHAYAEEYLFKHVPRVVLTSAVLQRKVAQYVGIDDAAMEFREFESTFDCARRPLIYIPTTRIDRNMTEGQTRQWISRIDAIIDTRLDRKGIIHAISYDRARTIVERSRHCSIMLTHSSRTTRETVEEFKGAKAPCVLVSPSLEEGYDFPGSACRFQILAKVPFIDGRSPIVQARARSDKEYLNYLTVMRMIQQVGRGVRASDDWCEAFIIDDHWGDWFRGASKHLFPAWFKAAWRTMNEIPAPLDPAMLQAPRIGIKRRSR